ncbi:MAG: VCBS repeat-containing protein [Candidatus Zixiibacteriota bacterium]|nr:MAG: VCBS repeat-containing protein [candidate division Zixibacteria bacterium]
MRSLILVVSVVLFSVFTAFAQAPQVVSVMPAQNEVSAAITSNITATFDMDMDPATIDNSTFSVYSRTYGYLSGTVTYDQPARTAAFNPAREFFHGDVVTATLTSGIGSLGGTPMDRGFSWTFTVIAGGVGAFGVFDEYDLNCDPNSVFLADLNMDDYPDIITGSISVFLNNGDGTFLPRTDYPTFNIAYRINAADLDRDGDIDIVAACDFGDVEILMNNGDGSFVSLPGLDVEDYLWGLYMVDIDGDIDLDMILGGEGEEYPYNCPLWIYTNDGYGNFSFDTTYTMVSTVWGICSRDFNNDGSPDISAICSAPHYLAILFNNGEGVFSSPFYYPIGMSYDITGADLNHDGFIDLAVPLFYDPGLCIFVNQGDGTFNNTSSYTAENRLYSVFASDLNGDQSIDLTVGSTKVNGNPEINTFLFNNNGDGTFDLNSTFNIADDRRVQGIFASDIDLDGDLDLVAANRENRSITVLKNVPACGYVTGDVNGSESYNGLDIIYAVNYFKGGPPPPYECECTAGNTWYVVGDVNASCGFNGLDITYGVSYFKGGPPPQPCADCPPAQ